jgi:hypothetical protein
MSFINQQEIKNIVNTINSIPDCRTLQNYEKLLINRLTAQLQQTLASLNLLAGLIVNPGDLPAVITWIKNFIEANIIGPYYKLLALEIELMQDFEQLTTAIESKLLYLTCSAPGRSSSVSVGSSVLGSSTFGG